MIYPPGTRVRKVNSEPGDGHQDGSLGTVVAVSPASTEPLTAPSGRVLPVGTVAYFVEWDGMPGIPVASLDFKVETVTVCDFCSALNPPWEFPANDFILASPNNYQSVGSWAACQECAALIEGNEWRTLGARSRDRTFNGQVLTRAIGPDEALSYLMQIHRQFHKHRIGDKFPYGSRD